MDLVAEYMELTAADPAPAIFRKWSAITLVSAVLSRKVGSRVVPRYVTYPNLFTLLVGPPGSGKTVAVSAALDIAREVLPESQIAPDAATARRFTSRMSLDEEPEDKIDVKLPVQEVMCKQVGFLSEWSNFLPPHEQGYMTILSQLWDCPDEYKYETEHSGRDFLYNVYVTLLGGVQPFWFGKLTDTAFEQGFATRLMMVYSDDTVKPKLFAETDTVQDKQRRAMIVSRLNQIESFDAGDFYWYPASKARLQLWYSEGQEPVPKHPLLKGYRERRLEMLVRLAMISGASAHAQPIVKLEDVERAMEWMFEAEATTPAALSRAGSSPFHQFEITLVAEVRAQFDLTGKSIPEPTVRRWLGRNVPAHLVGQVLEGIIAQGRLVAVGEEKAPRRRLLPGKNDD